MTLFYFLFPLPFGKSLIGQNRFWIGDGASRPIEILSQNTDLLKQFNNKIHWSNDNQIVNWYLGDPINQFGLKSYEHHGVEQLDRWSCDDTLTIEDGYVHPSSNLYQTVSTCEVLRLRGRYLTLSALYADGTFESGSMLFPNTIPGKQTFIRASENQYIVVSVDDGAGGVQIYRNSSKKPIVAVKVEIGLQQTLAYLDENRKWVLNDVMNYIDELKKCQSYRYNVFYTNGGVASFAGLAFAITETVAITHVNLPAPSNTTMRLRAHKNVCLELPANGNTKYPVTRILLDRINNINAKFSLVCSGGGLTVGQLYILGPSSDDAFFVIDSSL